MAESRYGPVAVVSRRRLPPQHVSVSQVLRALTHLQFCDVGVVFRFSCVKQINPTTGGVAPEIGKRKMRGFQNYENTYKPTEFLINLDAASFQPMKIEVCSDTHLFLLK